MNYKKNLIYFLVIFFSTISLTKSSENIAYLDLLFALRDQPRLVFLQIESTFIEL